jgi:hypothetical protein
VQAALKDGTFALIILGGAHDLSESVRRHAGGLCEYLRSPPGATRSSLGRSEPLWAGGQ